MAQIVSQDTNFFDMAVIGAFADSKKDRNVSFGFDTKDTRFLASADIRLTQLEQTYHLPTGSLRRLFSAKAPEGASVVHWSAPKILIPQEGHRYLYSEKPKPGDVVEIYWNLIKASGRIEISETQAIDPHFLRAYTIALGKEIHGKVLKSMMMGLAKLNIIIENALPKLLRVNLQSFFQWAKNQLSLGSSA